MGIIYKNGIPYGNQPSIDATLTHQGEAADAKATGDAVSELRNTLSHKADVIYDTASGDIASFPDGADGLPVKDLTVVIEPVQSGTGDPSPTNVRPISGWTGCNVSRTGKNLIDLNDYTPQTIANGITYTQNSDGTIIANGTATGESMRLWVISGNVASAFSGKMLSGSPFKDGVSVSLQRNASPYNNYAVCEGNATVISTVDSSVNAVLFIYIDVGTVCNNLVFKPTISEGELIPISWQSSAGTVYAASLDALAGSLKVRPYYASYNGETLVGPWISSMDAYTPGGTPTTGAQVVDFGGSETLYSLDAIALNTLLGQNNIFADCGPSTVEYPCDTKLYIQKINAPTDDDMIADAQIASGKYFIVGNNLYLSTTTILAGDPIKPGTNCTLTNLAAALNALNS